MKIHEGSMWPIKTNYFHMKNLLLTTLVLFGLAFVSQAQNTHTIGEKFDGGIVFEVTPDGQHGLIAKPQDQGMCNWNEAQALIEKLAKQRAAGKTLTGWRLPKKEELDKLFERRQIVGGFTSNRTRPAPWSNSTCRCKNHHPGQWYWL